MKKVLQSWLFDQCRMLPGAKQAVLLTGTPGQGPYDRAYFWPDKVQNQNALSRVAKAALHNQKAVIKTRNSTVEKTGEPLDALGCPLFLDDALFGVVAIEMTHRSGPMQQASVLRVQNGVKWLENMIRLHNSTAREQLVNLVDLVAAGLEHEKFKVAASEVANELADRFGCVRVSLGFRRYNRVRVEAMSRSSRMDQHSNQVRAIRDAMGESLDQGATIVYPPAPETALLATQLHARLAKLQNGTAICTLPLIKNGKTVGALLLERGIDSPFDKQTIEQCEQIGLLLGPVLETRRRDERPLPFKLLASVQGFFGKLFGRRHLGLKAAVGLTVALVVWVSAVSAVFRITSDSVLEADICRAVVAPQNGYIADAHVRAGDLVHEGDPLVTLDDHELRLEQRKWLSQRAQLLKEYRKALAGFDRAEIAILNAKRAQAEAQLKLVEYQLARTVLKAPFTGIIVKGDLTQNLGSPVKPGEVLYEVAPNDDFRVVLMVDDRDIGLISPGQRGHLRLSGMPDQKIAITIERMTPVSATEEGRNYFRVEAIMDLHSDLMRSGMEGISKIEVGRKKLVWIWTRRLVNWLRLFAWNRLP